MKTMSLCSQAASIALATTQLHCGAALSQPYLQAVTTKSIYVLVESKSPGTTRVEYGPDTAYGAEASTESVEQTTDETFVHNVRLDGLLPWTMYHYRAIQGSDTSADASFRTAPDPGTPFRFLWMADFRKNTDVHDSIAARAAGFRADVALYGGDLCTSGSYEDFKREFFRPRQSRLNATVPFFNATGNHEQWGRNTRAFTQAPASASGTQDYYSFNYGDMHVLVLNTEIPYTAGSPQFEFARRDLSGATRTWKIVIAHKHPYAAGGHGEDEDLKRMATEIFEPANVDLVLTGHSHFYQHNIIRGIHYMIVGSVGAPLVKPDTASYTVRAAKEYDFAVADVSPATFRMVVYNERGSVLDSLELSKPR